MTDYSELVRKMRTCIGDKKCFEKECRYWSELGCMDGNICCDAAAAIEELQQIAEHYEQTAKEYWKEACEYKTQLPKRGEIVRCRECKYWSEVDTSDGLRYGQCDRPGSAIRGNCFIRESWFCADGERKVQE